MRVIVRGPRLVVRDTPGCFWLFGLWFVAGGVLATAMPFVATNAHELAWWERLLSAGLGLGVAGAGVYVLAEAPAIRAEFDRERDRARVVTRGLLRRTELEIRCSDVTLVELREERDSDGDATYLIRLRLRDGRAVPLQSRPMYGRTWAEARAAPLREFFGPRAG